MPDDSVLTPLFPAEVVTRALIRDVQLPDGAGTMALITLDNGHDHTRPNTFGPAGLLALRDALDAVAARAQSSSGIAAVGVTGKPFIFAAGADLGVAALIRARDEALAVGRLGHEVFRRFGELSVPSFAFVNGAALADALFEPADFLASSLRWAARVLNGSVPVPRTVPEEDWAAAAASARFFADGKLQGLLRRPTGPSSWWPRPGTGPVRRASPPRTKGWPTCCSATSCRPACTRST
jgi:hypothetical protein